MYARRIDDTDYTFGVSGKLLWNNLLMYDHQTESLWVQALGEAITGPMRATTLEAVPSVQVDWATWKQLYPQSQVLSKRTSPYGARAYTRDVYESYYSSSDTGIVPTARRSKLLPDKEKILGLHIQGRAKAYSLSALNKEPVVNDVLNDTPIVVVYQEGGPSGLIFSRVIEGASLTFSLATTSPEGPILTDAETGTQWAGLTGQALAGPLQGQRLEQRTSFLSFWFDWFDFFPDTEVFGAQNP